MEGRDTKHTSRSRAIGPDTPDIWWETEISANSYRPNEGVFGSDGSFYVQTNEGVCAINPSGIVAWRYLTPGYDEFIATPAITAEGLIYAPGPAQDSKPTLCAYYPDGTISWVHPACAGRHWGSPVVAEDGTIYAAHDLLGNGTCLHAFSKDGVLLWTCELDGVHPTCPAVASDGTIYYAPREDHLGKSSNVYAIDSGGNIEWTFSANSNVFNRVSIGDDGSIYFGDCGGYAYALYEDGSVKWQCLTGGSLQYSPTIGKDGSVYYGSDDRYLYAFSSEGDLEWSYYLGYRLQSNIVVDAAGNIYASAEHLVSLTPAGILRWMYRPDKSLSWAAYSLDPSGSLYALFGKDSHEFVHVFGVGSQVLPTVTGVSPQVGISGEVIQFEAACGGSIPSEYYWNFGGGVEPNTSEEASPTVILSGAGEYGAVVIVRNQFGETSFPFTLTIRETSHTPWISSWGRSVYRQVRSLTADNKGNIWACLDQGLYKLSCEGDILSAEEIGLNEVGSWELCGLATDTSRCLYAGLSGGSIDSVLLKFSESGAPIWGKKWNGGEEALKSVFVDNEGNIELIGHAYIGSAGIDDIDVHAPDILLLRYSPDGDLLSSKALRSDGMEQVSGAAINDAGEIYVAGQEIGWGYGWPLAACIASDGQLKWMSCWQTDGILKGITADEDGNSYAIGSRETSGDNAQILLKFNPTGDILWSKYLISPDYTIHVNDISLSQDGLLNIVGRAGVIGSDGDGYLLLLQADKNGRILRSLVWIPVDDTGGGSVGNAICSSGLDVYIGGYSKGSAGSWNEITTLSVPAFCVATPLTGTMRDIIGVESSTEFTVTEAVEQQETSYGDYSKMLLMKNFPP
jgi:sugar lactone lactonase YvrE